MARLFAAAITAGSIAALTFAASALAAKPPAMEMGPPAAWNDTGAKPVVERDAKNQPTRITLVIPAKLFDALPKTASEAVYPAQNAGLVQTANLQWHPMGHPPAHVYDVPHFDVHFYTITESVRRGVLPNTPGAKVMPAKKILPPNGLLDPEVIPGMGMHDVPKSSPEFNKGKFAVTPILGYWNGNLAFFEVMFTKDFIALKRGMVGAFPQPASVKQHGAYPTKYSVKFDKAQDEYEVALTDFVQR